MYSIANWLTLGLLDLGKGAIDPERTLSLEHWLDSLGFASALYGMSEAAKQAIILREAKPNVLIPSEHAPFDDEGGSRTQNNLDDQIQNIIDTHGFRNDLPLTSEQIRELKEYAKELGFSEEKIYIADMITSSNTGMLYDELLLINNDVLPTNRPTRNPNSLVTGRATIAHEVIGHYETSMKGTSFNQYDIINNQLVRNSYHAALDEAQASIKAARFAPGLTYKERIVLIKDALQRLKKEGIKINDVRIFLDILER